MFQTASLLIISARVSQNFFPRKRVKFPLFISSKGIFQTIDSSLVFYSTVHKTLKRLKHSALNINFTCNKQVDISLQREPLWTAVSYEVSCIGKKKQKDRNDQLCHDAVFFHTCIRRSIKKYTTCFYVCARGLLGLICFTRWPPPCKEWLLSECSLQSG